MSGPPEANVTRLMCAPRIITRPEASLPAGCPTACSFCCRSPRESGFIVGSAHARICDACLNDCAVLIAERDESFR